MVLLFYSLNVVQFLIKRYECLLVPLVHAVCHHILLLGCLGCRLKVLEIFPYLVYEGLLSVEKSVLCSEKLSVWTYEILVHA